jgi:large subunit ribosomal protein L25
MSQKISFTAQTRTIEGKKVKQLRKQGKIPANISGNVEKTVPVSLDKVGFTKLYEKVGDTGLFYVKVEGEEKDRPVLVSEDQRDPISGELVHVVLRQVNLSEKIKAEVPVEVIGVFEIKDALVVTVHDAIEVEAFPQDLPEKFEIDISQFTEVGQMVTFNQLNYDKSKVTLMVEEDQLDSPVVLVQEVKEEVEEVVVAAPAEGDAAAPAPTEGGEAAAAPEEKKE